MGKGAEEFTQAFASLTGRPVTILVYASSYGLFARGGIGFNHRALTEGLPFAFVGTGADPASDSARGGYGVLVGDRSLSFGRAGLAPTGLASKSFARTLLLGGGLGFFSAWTSRFSCRKTTGDRFSDGP